MAVDAQYTLYCQVYTIVLFVKKGKSWQVCHIIEKVLQIFQFSTSSSTFRGENSARQRAASSAYSLIRALDLFQIFMIVISMDSADVKNSPEIKLAAGL